MSKEDEEERETWRRPSGSRWGGRGVMDARTESSSLISQGDVPKEGKGSRNRERSLGG